MSDTDSNGIYWLQEDDPSEIVACFDQDIRSEDGAHVVELCREIVNNHAAQMIDGAVVDVQSANAIVTVFDGLNGKNREAFVAKRSSSRMGQIAWKVLARMDGRSTRV